VWMRCKVAGECVLLESEMVRYLQGDATEAWRLKNLVSMMEPPLVGGGREEEVTYTRSKELRVQVQMVYFLAQFARNFKSSITTHIAELSALPSQ